MDIIDTHCHLDVAIFNADRDRIIGNCRQLGIKKIFIPAIQSSSWDNLLDLCEQYSVLSPMLGLHPMFISQHQESDLVALDSYLNQHQPCAVGEIGLDYFIKNSDKEKQLAYFSNQLDMAKQHGLPVILHVRKAHQQVLKILKQKGIDSGIVHAFNGSKEEALRYIELGFKLGFGGMLTFPRSTKLHRLAIDLPLSALVLETDAPDMTGMQHHGERNSPEYLPEYLQALSKLRQEPMDEIAAQTTSNANQILARSVSNNYRRKDN